MKLFNSTFEFFWLLLFSNDLYELKEQKLKIENV